MKKNRPVWVKLHELRGFAQFECRDHFQHFDDINLVSCYFVVNALSVVEEVQFWFEGLEWVSQNQLFRLCFSVNFSIPPELTLCLLKVLQALLSGVSGPQFRGIGPLLP